MTLYGGESYGEGLWHQSSLDDSNKTSSPINLLDIKQLLDKHTRTKEAELKPPVVPTSFLPEVIFITDAYNCAGSDEPLKNVTINGDNLKLLGPEAKAVLDFLSIESISVFSNDGKSYLSLEFKKDPSFGKKEVELFEGVGVTVTDPGDGKRHVELPAGVGSITLNRKINAEIVKDDKGIRSIKQINGIEAMVPTKVGNLSVTVDSITVLKDDGKTAKLEIRGRAVGQAQSVTVEVPSEKVAKLNSLLTAVDTLRTNPPKEIISTQSPEDLLKADEEPSYAKRIATVLALLVFADALRQVFRGTTELLPPERPVSKTTVDGKVLKPNSRLLIDKFGTVTEYYKTPDAAGTIEYDKNGRMFIEPTDKDSQVFIKDKNGKIQRHIDFPPGGVEILPGESFHITSQRDNLKFGIFVETNKFIKVAQRDMSPLVAKFSNPKGADLRIGFQLGDSVEVGAGKSKGLIPSNSASARVEPGEYISSNQAKFEFDEKGVFIKDGELVKNGENIPSDNGTWVNGKKLEPGEKRYLKAGDKVTFGEPGKPATVEVTMEQASDRAGANSPEISSDVTKPRVVRVIRSDVGKGQYFEAVPNQEIVIGPELDLNVGGQVKKGRASLIINPSGEAFLKVFPGSSALIEKANGDIYRLQAEYSSVPIEPTDKISIDGSPYFRIDEKIASGLNVKIGKETFKLNPGETIHLGRDQDQTITDKRLINFENSRISKEHAIIGVDELGRLYIEETNRPSKNGTFVNGERLMPGRRQYLNASDHISLGNPAMATAVRIEIGSQTHLGRGLDTSNPDHAQGDPVYKKNHLYKNTVFDTVNGYEIPLPADIQKCKIVGQTDAKNIRIRGGLSTSHVREERNLSPSELNAIKRKEPGLGYEKIELTIGDEKVTYYKTKDDKFFRLYEDVKNPRLVRDVELFVEPPSGPPDKGPDLPGDKPKGGPGTGDGDKPKGGPGTGDGDKPKGGSGTGDGDKPKGGPGTGDGDKPKGGPGTGDGDKPKGSANTDDKLRGASGGDQTSKGDAVELAQKLLGGTNPEQIAKMDPVELRLLLQSKVFQATVGLKGDDLQRMKKFQTFLDNATDQSLRELLSELKLTPADKATNNKVAPSSPDPKAFTEPKSGIDKPNPILPSKVAPTAFDGTPKPAGVELRPPDKVAVEPGVKPGTVKTEPIPGVKGEGPGRRTLSRTAAILVILHGLDGLFGK